MVVRDLCFAYEPGQPVIEGLTAELRAGRLCALIGPNAAGKSTLLRLLLGQLEPASGSVAHLGRPVAALKPAERAARISYVPQRAGVSFAYTVQQVVAMGRFALPDDPAAVARAMQRCDVTELGQRVYAQLSVGQQQRVILARAMAQASGGGTGVGHGHAKVMLLDEPVSAMDLWHIHQTMRLLVELTRGGMALLVVLHDLNLAARYADEVWLIDGGALVAAGPWDQVLSPPVLEPVYRVRLSRMTPPGSQRPVFLVDGDGTL
jgi:iron complex transport system ATP-binding protein